MDFEKLYSFLILLFRGVYLSNIGFNGVGQITATVHKNTSLDPNNAWFDTYTGQLFFGDGTPSQGFYDFSKEDKIIYREYTHAMTHSIVNLYGGYNESDAIDEGTPIISQVLIRPVPSLEIMLHRFILAI